MKPNMIRLCNCIHSPSNTGRREHVPASRFNLYAGPGPVFHEKRIQACHDPPHRLRPKCLLIYASMFKHQVSKYIYTKLRERPQYFKRNMRNIFTKSTVTCKLLLIAVLTLAVAHSFPHPWESNSALRKPSNGPRRFSSFAVRLRFFTIVSILFIF